MYDAKINFIFLVVFLQSYLIAQSPGDSLIVDDGPDLEALETQDPS